jgi:hypothetical protein
MATVTARRDGRFELRESVRTPAGPRSRTLATFRVLTDDVIDRAAQRATGPIDRGAIRARARRLGVPDERERQARLARELIAQLRRGERSHGAWPRVLSDELRARRARREHVPDSIPPLVEWLGVDERERGKALRDLLRLTDRIPSTRPPGPLTFPRLDSTASRG